MLFVSCVSHAFASVYCCLVVTCWERADRLADIGGVCCILRDFKKAPFNIFCLFNMIYLRIFSSSFYNLLQNGP